MAQVPQRQALVVLRRHPLHHNRAGHPPPEHPFHALADVLRPLLAPRHVALSTGYPGGVSGFGMQTGEEGVRVVGLDHSVVGCVCVSRAFVFLFHVVVRGGKRGVWRPERVLGSTLRNGPSRTSHGQSSFNTCLCAKCKPKQRFPTMHVQVLTIIELFTIMLLQL